MIPGGKRQIRGSLVAIIMALTVPASADYETSPDLRPSVRCAGLEDPSSPTDYSPHCQPMFWDLPAAGYVGQRGLATVDPATGFPLGVTDRPPPIWVVDQNLDGVLDEADGGDTNGNGVLDPTDEGAEGFEENLGPNRSRLCPDVADVPYWRATGETEPVTDAFGAEVEAEWFEVDCRRGTRAVFGAFHLGEDLANFDLLALRIIPFDNSGRLDADIAAGVISGPSERGEMNVSSAVYTHVGTHHLTCEISTHPCADGTNPEYANSEACDGFRALADECPAEGPGTRCDAENHDFVAFRTTSSRNGRYTMDLPDGRAFPVPEDPMWLCNFHVINDEPPAYGSTVRRDFRRQQGGTVGEAVFQFFTEPFTAEGIEPVSITFDFVASGVTTYVPPFTIAPQDTYWYAPFDLALGMATLHSHENMVKGAIEVLPGTAPRIESNDPACGGTSPDGTPSRTIYENYSYFEPNACEYWREPDGPIILRKGDVVRTSCIVNNGVNRTDMIENEALRTAVEDGPIGRELLYGEQDPSAYRVRYACEYSGVRFDGGAIPTFPGPLPGAPARNEPRDCPSNPETDDQGRPVDGAYTNTEACPPNEGFTGECVPAPVVFANTGEDAMCIPILMYWPLDRIVDENGNVNGAAMEELMAGNVDEVGTPGRIWKSPSDRGSCHDGSGDGGVSVGDPNFMTPAPHCSAGL